MSIAVFADDPWICVVYYVMDENLNLYFISDPETEHSQAIAENNNVSAAIYDSHQEVSDKKVGVQIMGEVSVVGGLGKIKWFFEMWAKINPGNKDILNLKNYKNKILSSKVYVIKPRRIKFFNEALYGSDEFAIFESEDLV